MEVATMMRWAIVGVGLFVSVASFHSHASKKMTSDLATVWFLLGIVIMVIGAVPSLSRWLDQISGWTGVALFFIGAMCLWAAFRICLILSRLVTQNQELAMQVSLLLGAQQPQPGTPAESEETAPEERNSDEKSFICH